MKERSFLRRLMSKTGTGLFFVAACFAAIFILVEFHSNYILVGIAALLLLVSAYLFLNALFEEKSKEWRNLAEEDDPRKSMGDEESGLRSMKYMKEMVTELKKQTELMENIENEIYMLSEKQVTQTKAVIKYNKENARQIALSGRDAIKELKESLTGGVVVAATKENVPEDIFEESVVELPEEIFEEAIVELPEEIFEEPVVELPEEIFEEPVVESQEEVFEESVIELPDDVAVDLPETEDMSVGEEIGFMDVELPEDLLGEIEAVEMPEDLLGEIEAAEMPEDLFAEIEIAEEEEEPELPPIEDIVLDDLLFDEPIAVEEEIIPELMVEEEASVADEPAAAPALSSDPNAMMTPDDIAKLIASMGQ